MSCRKWRVELSKRYEGELNEQGEAGLFRHLESCRRRRTPRGNLVGIFVSAGPARAHALPVEAAALTVK